MEKISNHLGNEELARVQRMITTRAENRAKADYLFETASKFRKMDRAMLEKLFVQMPAAQIMSQQLVKTSAAEFADEILKAVELEKQAAAPNTLSYFENQGWLTDAQKRFPELQKVADSRPAPTTKTTAPLSAKTGKTPTRSNLSGGAA